jgi:predicted small lipoprotein YifL
MKTIHWVVLLALLMILSACGQKPLLEDVSVAPETITPNADGQTDLTKITFTLNRTATVSVMLVDAQGQAFTFRPPRRLSLNEKPYTVYFGGVVDGFALPDEAYDYTILKRMLPDGIYTWEIRAEVDEGETAVVTGTLAIEDADTTLPGIRGLSVSPKTFSPNQDGLDDRVRINLTLEKDVEELRVYLEGPDRSRHTIAEDEQVTEINAKGWHTFDYDGGIDAGAEPPPDGTYVVSAEARDRMGQRVIAQETLEIINAGLPRAYILNGEVTYSATSLVISETLCFTLTVENDSATYLRTIGPWPGTMYRSDQNFNTLDYSEESGVFRVAMDFDTSLRNYPFRWGIGQPGVDLVQVGENWYLPPSARSQVTGCVQIVETPVRNPLYYWMGLIHEDVGIANVNNRVDPNYVTIWEP